MGKKRSKSTTKKKNSKASAFSLKAKTCLSATVKVSKGTTSKNRRLRTRRTDATAVVEGGHGGRAISRRRMGGWNSPKIVQKDQINQCRRRKWSGNDEDISFAKEMKSLTEREDTDDAKCKRVRARQIAKRCSGRRKGGTVVMDGLFGDPSHATFHTKKTTLDDMVHITSDRMSKELSVVRIVDNGASMDQTDQRSPKSELAETAVGHSWTSEEQEYSCNCNDSHIAGDNRFAVLGDRDEDGGGDEVGGAEKSVIKRLLFDPPSFHFQPHFQAESATWRSADVAAGDIDPDL